MSRTAKILVGLLAAFVLVVLAATISRADVIDVQGETTTTTSLPQSFDLKVVEVAVRARGCAHAWQISLDNPIRNTFGHVQVWPALDAIWCAGKNYAKVTNLIDLSCYSKGGFYAYDGCKKSHGSLGFSFLPVHANWHYHWIINGLTFDKTPALNVNLYPNGHAVGTWYWFTA